MKKWKWIDKIIMIILYCWFTENIIWLKYYVVIFIQNYRNNTRTNLHYVSDELMKLLKLIMIFMVLKKKIQNMI